MGAFTVGAFTVGGDVGVVVVGVVVVVIVVPSLPAPPFRCVRLLRPYGTLMAENLRPVIPVLKE
ncbi:hypothetical protein SM007_41415 [Streptomyces avermitilis]|nr:hypothetical protein SM007_41415 [Streptomyces avermitilis]